MFIEGATGGLPKVIESPDEDDPDEEDEDDPVCHIYRPCDVETNLYEVGWENFGQAWSIWTNPDATTFQRAGAGYYMGVWGGAHGLAAIGVAGLACAALGPGCVKPVESALTFSPIIIQGFARGGPEWHIGLETVKKMNIIHVGRHAEYGVHIAFGAIKPYVADFHIYVQKALPFFRTFRPPR